MAINTLTALQSKANTLVIRDNDPTNKAIEMKILVVHEVSYKKKPVYEYQDFAERLAYRGHEVTVIDFDEAGSGKDKPGFLSKTGLATVNHQPIQHINFPILNILNARHSYKKNLEEAIRNKKYDIALVYSVFVNGCPTVKLFNEQKIPVVYRVLDIYHKIRKNIVIQYPLLYGEKFIYRNSNLVLTTNQKLSDYVIQLKNGLGKSQVEVLDHGVDCSHFRPIPKSSELMKKYGIQSDDKILLFLGTTYDFSGIDIILESMPRILKSSGNVKFLVVGAGELDQKLKSMASALNLETNFLHLGMQPYDKLPELLALADIVLNPFKINEITRSIIPIKTLQYIASGKPCISAPLKDVMNLMPSESSGVRFCDIEDSDSYIKEIENLLKLPTNKLAELGEKGRRFALDNLSIDRQIDKLEKHFQNLVRSAT